jgi:hypothetical protein
MSKVDHLNDKGYVVLESNKILHAIPTKLDIEWCYELFLNSFFDKLPKELKSTKIWTIGLANRADNGNWDILAINLPLNPEFERATYLAVSTPDDLLDEYMKANGRNVSTQLLL